MKLKLYFVVVFIFTFIYARPVSNEIFFDNGQSRKGEIIGGKGSEIYFCSNDTLFYFNYHRVVKIMDENGENVPLKRLFLNKYSPINWDSYKTCIKIDNKPPQKIDTQNRPIEYKLSLSQTEKILIYEQARKKTEIARMLAWYIPSAGYLYCGNYVKSTFCLAGLGASTYLFQKGKSYHVFGIAGILGCKIFEIIDSGNEASNYNENLRRRLFDPKMNNLSVGLNYQDCFTQISVSYRF